MTDRDLALKVVAEGRDAASTKVEAVMTRNVVTCRADDDVQKALDAMSEHQLRRIPVVDGDNRILGIISQADVATRVDQPEKTAAVVKGILAVQQRVREYLDAPAHHPPTAVGQYRTGYLTL